MTQWISLKTGRSNSAGGGSGFVRLTGDTMTGALGITQGTITASTPILNLTSTFNNNAVTFNGLVYDVTNTASGPSSNIFDFRRGGTSLLRLSINSPSTLTAAGTIEGNVLRITGGGQVDITTTGIFLQSAYTLRWNDDVVLARDAADSLALRRTTNAQRFDIYNTYTSGTNHERLALRWNSGVATIETQRGSGAGSAQPLVLGTDSTERMRMDTLGNVVVNTAAIPTNATNGFLYVPSCAGTPTGTPTTFTGRVPIVVDTTNNKLYFYSGGAWRDAGP